MKRVLYASAYVPAELITAHGLRPERAVPGGCGATGPVPDTAGTCAYMRAFLSVADERTDVAALIATTECDQLRRGSELAQREGPVPVFLMHVPATRGAAAREAYEAELRRLAAFLARVGGRAVSDGELRAQLCASAREPAVEGAATTPAAGVPLALLGGHLTEADRELTALVRELGGRIVLDGTDLGPRTRPAPGRELASGDDPYRELVRTHYDHIPGVFQRPNTALYEWLSEHLPQSGARAVVFVRYVWCDLWHAEVERLREHLDIPVLDVDLGGGDALARNRMRLQALLESLEVGS